MELLTNGTSNSFHCQSCENLKENLSFLQKELLAKDEFIKSLLETQTAILNLLSSSKSKPGSLSSSCSFSIQNEEENMENKVEKDKRKIKQSEKKKEKNVSKLYIGNLNSGTKENGLNTTKYVRKTCSLNMRMNNKTGQPKGYSFMSAPKHVCHELLKQIFFHVLHNTDLQRYQGKTN